MRRPRLGGRPSSFRPRRAGARPPCLARRGRWGGKQLLPAAWIEAMITPSPTNGSYGYLWWLNRAGVRYRGASEACFYATGAGSNIIWIDPEHDLVTVLRWIDKAAVGGFLTRLTASVT
jgi:CubicO group peptidase (beta-lactamase class C family)